MPAAVENGTKVILRAAKAQLEEEGYRSFSIRKIAQRCGLATGTIYNYFPTKHDLMVELMVDYWDAFFASGERTLADGSDVFDQLRQVYAELRHFVALFQDAWVDAQEVSAVPRYGMDSPREKVYLERLYGLVRELLQQQGGAAPDLDLDELSRFIVLGFLTLIFTNQLSYAAFERILRSLLASGA